MYREDHHWTLRESEPLRVVATLVDVMTWLAVAGVLVSVGWTQHSCGSTTSGLALITIVLLGGLGLLARLLPAPWDVLGVVLVGGGAAVAVAMTTRETFSLWMAGSALLCLVFAPARQRIAQNPSFAPVVPAVVFLTAATGGVLWAATHAPRDVAPHLFPVAAAVLMIATSVGAIKGTRQVIAWRTRAAAAAHLQRSNADLERRAALARELHDTLGHSITAMVIQAEAGHVEAPTQALRSIGALGRVAMDDLETVLFDLRRGVTTTAGPAAAVMRLEDRLLPPLRAAGISATANVDTRTTDHAVLLAVYRVAQESITNVMKHSGARAVTVEVLDVGDDVVVRIRDDGHGGDSWGVTRGLGVAGMRARVEELGGTFRWTGSTSEGVTVEAIIPRVVA